MEDSILNATKKVLGLAADYTAFDVDVITHINSTFSIVNQLGIGPVDGFAIEDADAEWVDLSLPPNQLNVLRTYMFLRVKMLFDPPSSGFLITAMNQQIQEYETRLSYMRESTLPAPTSHETIEEEVFLEWLTNTWG